MRPLKDNELYFSGLVHDQNARIEVYSWNEFFTVSIKEDGTVEVG